MECYLGPAEEAAPLSRAQARLGADTRRVSVPRPPSSLGSALVATGLGQEAAPPPPKLTGPTTGSVKHDTMPTSHPKAPGQAQGAHGRAVASPDKRPPTNHTFGGQSSKLTTPAAHACVP